MCVRRARFFSFAGCLGCSHIWADELDTSTPLVGFELRAAHAASGCYQFKVFFPTQKKIQVFLTSSDGSSSSLFDSGALRLGHQYLFFYYYNKQAVAIVLRIFI